MDVDCNRAVGGRNIELDEAVLAATLSERTTYH